MKPSVKDNKRKAILDAATELMVLKPTATLQEIADHAHIGIATLHRYFSTRELLLDALALNAIGLVDEALTGILNDDSDMLRFLTEVFEVLIPLGSKMSFLSFAASVEENPDILAEEARVKQPLREAVEGWQTRGLLNAAMPAHWMITVMYNLLFVAWQEIQNGNLAKNDAPQLLVSTVIQGFGAPGRSGS
ncbi:TetR/AcrR family transcriptional regulator [Paenibacillus tritici]|uniref:TetR/AcrR family transcriptional regulator n=1 Tax=Paenibacillus tritici TaxID=1873425 RepID=A0ABX2DJA2_9BACL|nr:TetR/AcrR family transcriptional regulator [Paenibacillus tritici]NQX44387.1 TetR/AcrR family transcriptional regulator [Paenibacillus tritici]